MLRNVLHGSLVCTYLLVGCSSSEPGPSGPEGSTSSSNASGTSTTGTSTLTTSAAGGSTSGGTGTTSGSTGTATGSTGTATGGTGTATSSTSTTGTTGLPSDNPCAPDPSSDDLAFSAPSGSFSGELSVELSTSQAGAEIRYTIDGSLPTASSSVYSTPLLLTQTTQLRAQPFQHGVPLAPVATALYVARSFDQTHDIPLLVLDSYGSGPLSQQNRDFVDVAVLAWDSTNNALSGLPTLASHAGFHIRGQSSASFDKTPYRLELRDTTDEDLDCPVLGMPAEADFALVGPFADKSLIRNAIVYGLGRDMGLASPRFALAEVYLNVESRPLEAGDYMGVYQIVETIKNQKDRLNLQQLKAPDTMLPELSGGYIFKFEWLAAEEPILVCTGSMQTCWSDLEVVDPDPLQPEQNAWLTQHIQEFHDAINSPNFTDPSSGYAAYLDVASFVDFIIINELTRNMDAYVRSQYFYKDRDSKIFAGPLWDYNLIFGVGGAFDSMNIEGWQYEENAMRDTSNWFQRLLEDPAFVAQLATRWQELRQGLLSEAQLSARIATLTSGLAAAAERNFQRWDNLGDQQVGPFTTPTAPTWQGQVDTMQSWLFDRLAWLDTQWQ